MGYEIIMFTNSHKSFVSTNDLIATNRFRMWLTNNAAARVVTGVLENTFQPLGTNAPWIANYSTNAFTVAFPIRSGSTNFQWIPWAGNLVIHGVNLENNAVRIWGNNPAAGVIFRGAATGSAWSVLSLESNTWARFEASPEYRGLTRVRGGRLEFAVSSGASHTNILELGSSNGTPATIRFASGGITIHPPIHTMPGSTAIRSIDLAFTGDVFQTGGLVVNSPLMVTGMSAAAVATFGGPISGTGAVTKTGPGEVFIAGSNTMSGSITIWSGTWHVAGVPLNSGTYTVNGGTLRIVSDPGPTHTNSITLAGFSPRFEFGGTNLTVSNRLIVSGGGNITRYILHSTTGVATFAGYSAISGNLVFSNSAGGRLRFVGTNNLMGGGRVFTIETNNIVHFEGAITNGSLSKRGLGDLVLGYSNAFVHLNLDGGTLRLTGTIAGIRGQYRIGPANGASNAHLVLENSGLLITNAIIVRNAGSRMMIAAYTNGTSAISGGINLQTSLIVEVAAGGILSCSNAIGGSGQLIKTGAGRLDLFGNGSFLGNSYVSQGVVRIYANSALGSTLGSNIVVSGAALELTNNLVVAERNVLNGSGIGGMGALRHLGGQSRLTGMTLIQSPSVVQVDSGSLTFQGALVGSSALTRQGSGNLVISNVHLLSGPVTLVEGTTYLRGHMSNAPVTVSGGAIFVGTGTVQSLSVAGWLDIGASSNLAGQLRVPGGATLHTSSTWMVSVSAATGTVPGLHWDLLNAIGGSLTIASTPTEPIQLRLSGNPSGWNASSPYSWLIATSSALVGFAPNRFSIDTSAFTPPLGGGTFAVTSTLTAIYLRFIPSLQPPSNITIIADGPEMVRISWSPGSVLQTIVTHNETNPPPPLTNGNVYSVGDPLGGGARVIYRGTATSLEHVVRAGSLNQYRLHAATGVVYSFGVMASTNTPFHPGPIADNFSYTNGAALTGLNGGVGWGSAWSAGLGSYFATNLPVFLPTNYYPRGGNALYLPPPGVNVDATRVRLFGQSYSTGSIYVAYTLRATLAGGSRRIGVLLTSNLVGRLFLGIPANTTVFGIQENLTSNGALTTVALNTNLYYTLIGRYTFDTRTFVMNVYTSSNTVPSSEPLMWQASYVVPPALAPNSINGLALHVRGWSGANNGATTFDEIRVAPNYTQLVAGAKMYVTNFYAGSGDTVTDEQLHLGDYAVIGEIVHDLGMTNDATRPNIDIVGPTGTVLLTDVLLTNLVYGGGGVVLKAGNFSFPPIPASMVELGVHTTRWSAISKIGDFLVDQSFDGGGNPLAFTVIDDDVRGPTTAGLFFTNVYSSKTLLFTGFETNESWPVFLAGGTPWTQIVTVGSATGTWIGTCGLTAGGAAAGARKLIFPAISTGRYVQLPPRAAAGTLTLDARLDGGTNDRQLELVYWTGSAWASLGTNTIVSTQYLSYSWAIHQAATTVYRIVRVGADGAPGIAVDHVELIADGALDDPENGGWTNATTIAISWEPARDDVSPISEYRLVLPSLLSAPPVSTNDGIGLPANTNQHAMALVNVEGVVTGWIAAIDHDVDRIDDRLLGTPRPFVLRIDTSPPPPVLSLAVTNDPLVDETVEMRIEWEPASSNMHEAAGWRQSDNEPLSPWDTYIIRVFELDAFSNVVSTAIYSRVASYPELGSNNTTTIVLSNLTEDTEYLISISGRDRAGNEGEATWITGRTVSASFGFTNSIAVHGSPTNIIYLTVHGSHGKPFDVLYVDALSFTNGLSNQWDIIWSVTTTPYAVLADVGGYNATNRYRPTPEELGPTMRFYRVAGHNQWKHNVHPQKNSSRDVHVMKTLRFVPGENWYSLFFEPVTNSIAHVFGTDKFPAGNTFATATRIHWFSPTNHGNSYNYSTNIVALYFNGSTNEWRRWTNDWGPVANNDPIPLSQGFMVELPANSATAYVSLVGRVLTNSMVIQIPGRAPSATNEAFYIMSWNYPYRLSLNELNLAGSGIAAHPIFLYSDEIRILQNRGFGSMEHPKIRARMTNQWNWRIFAYSTNVFSSPPTPNTKVIEPDDAIIFVRRSTNTIFWTNVLFYTPPGRKFDP